MADVEISTNDPFTLTLVTRWFESRDEVETLDEKMNIESFGRTKLLNTKFEEVNPGMEAKRANNPAANSVRGFLNADGLSDDEFVGLYETIRRVLASEYSKRIDAYVEKNLPKVDEKDKPNEEALLEYREERKKHVDNMNGIRMLLEGTATDWFKAEGDRLLPKFDNLRGAVGGREKTGERLGGTFRFTVIGKDGEETILSDPKLSALPAYTPFKKLGIKTVGEVRKAIEEANPGFAWKTPPDRFEFTLAGLKVVAHKLTDESSEADDEETNDIQELTLDVEDDNAEDFEENVSTETALFDDEDE